MRSLLAGLVALATLVATPVAAQPALTPPGATAPPPMAAPAPDWSAWAAYQAGKRNEGVAVVMELFLPGLGSLYGGHWEGAATTWGLFVGGFVLLAWGAQNVGFADGEGSDEAGLAIVAGVTVILGGRVYGLVDSYRATRRFNRRLAGSLGLRGLVLGPVPMQAGGQSTVGLGASWQF
jgi:hypothetical protein